MIITVVVLALAVLGLLVRQDRSERRMLEERASWQSERAGLLQRVQAPQVAVMDHSVQQHDTAPGVAHALTDEQAAEREEAARLIAELERQENEMLEARQF